MAWRSTVSDIETYLVGKRVQCTVVWHNADQSTSLATEQLSQLPKHKSKTTYVMSPMMTE